MQQEWEHVKVKQQAQAQQQQQAPSGLLVSHRDGLATATNEPVCIEEGGCCTFSPRAKCLEPAGSDTLTEERAFNRIQVLSVPETSENGSLDHRVDVASVPRVCRQTPSPPGLLDGVLRRVLWEQPLAVMEKKIWATTTWAWRYHCYDQG
jgi:hypothetical protein